MNYLELRKEYPEFTYTGFDYKLDGHDFVAEFFFDINPGISFHPSIRFKNIDKNRFLSLDKNVLNNLVFHLGLAEVPSYWKTACSPRISIEAGALSQEQLNWWKDLLLKGMGQYFYENKIDFTQENFVSLENKSDKEFKLGNNFEDSGVIIPVGGGKDSVVTLELLKNSANAALLMINPTIASEDISKASGVKRIVKIERLIDPLLLKLNDKGYLNGHTPFSSVVAFVSVAAAYIYGYTEVALSNERSADEENTTYMGGKINHQYSKTFEFENKFRTYVKKYLIDTYYFSFLRPLYDIQIAKIFSDMTKYHAHFRSCNVGQKRNEWCGNCSKCLSTYILLMPFLSEQELINIFGSDLLNKTSLAETLKDLTIESRVKPFECVGTRRELSDALSGNMRMLSGWNDNNNLPDKYERLLRDKIQK